MKKLPSTLSLQAIDMDLHLGVPEAERKAPQTISICLQLHFHTPPEGCMTDRIEDTLCYATLYDQIHTLLQAKSYHLIEHVGYVLYQFLETQYNEQGHWAVRVKKKPPLERCHCSEFTLGDWR